MGTDVISGASPGILGGCNTATRLFLLVMARRNPTSLSGNIWEPIGSLEIGHVNNEIPSKLNVNHYAELAKVDGAGSRIADLRRRGMIAGGLNSCTEWCTASSGQYQPICSQNRLKCS